MKTKEGVVFASDSRASSVLTSVDTVRKIFRLNDHVALGISGDGPLATHLFDTISEDLNFSFPITKLVEQFRELSKKKFDDWFSHLHPSDRPKLSILLAGYNGETPEVYTLRSDDNFVPRKSPTGFECIGVPYIAEYLLNRLYEPEVGTDQALEMTTFCIKETSSQDRSVGGPTQLAKFSNSESYSELDDKSIKAIEDKCDRLHVTHKAYFYPESKQSGFDKPIAAKRLNK